MSVEHDPRLRRLIARKGIDRTILDAGIGPEDVYGAWRDGHATAADAIDRIRKLAAEGGWIERIGEEEFRRRAARGDVDAALRVLDRVPDVDPEPGDEIR